MLTSTQANNLTSGRIYEQIILRERRGEYLGKTVQEFDPSRDQRNQSGYPQWLADVDVVICRDRRHRGRSVESLPFLEAIRQVRHEVGRENCIFVHVTLVPWISAAQELKTKPTQHSVKELRALGIQPDILLCRAERFLPDDMKEKIALFCDVAKDAVITAKDVSSVYEIPLVFAAEKVDEIILRHLRLDSTGPRNLEKWSAMLDRMQNPKDSVDIALCRKVCRV